MCRSDRHLIASRIRSLRASSLPRAPKELGDLYAMLNDNLSGIHEIKAFTREEDEYGRVSDSIFHGTVRENILFGRSDASEEEIIAAARVANAHAFIIAHRLSTIRKADTVVVLEGRQIEEIGTHEQLMARKGMYWRLYTAQKQLDAQADLASLQSKN